MSDDQFRIGFVGLGKLGLPVAVAIAQYGHKVIGYDLNPSRMSKDPQPYREAGPDGEGDFNNYLAASSIEFGTLREVVTDSEIIFVPVQTPHSPQYEGVTRIPENREDFDYSYLEEAVRQIIWKIGPKDSNKILAIISTVLPGTMRKRIIPFLPPNLKLVYTPSFIAMGTTMRDFLNPEFALVGSDDIQAGQRVRRFYDSLGIDVREMTVESAELTKVAYNTAISTKIAVANTIMEICHCIPEADCDQVTRALQAATTRIVSPAYMSGGMGDGGGCHPRDNIAMSWLAQRIGLSHDLFNDIMTCREDQTAFLANLALRESKRTSLPIVLMGRAFKPETNITVGSPAILLRNLIEEKRGKYSVVMLDCVCGDEYLLTDPAVYVISCRHDGYYEYVWPTGSVVIDPHRYIPEQEGVKVIRVGEGR